MRNLLSVSLIGTLCLVLGGCGAPPSEDGSASVEDQVLELELDMDDEADADDASCRERCASHAREVFAQCKGAGGGDDECRARAREALGRCLERCAPESCRERCRAQARQVFQRCKDAGGGDRECRVRAMEAFRRCALACRPADGANDRPEMRPAPTPERASCQERCRFAARRAFHACVEGGADREACMTRARQSFRECLGHCDGRDAAADPLEG